MELAKLTESKYPAAIRCGAYLLMDADKEAQECFNELPPVAQIGFLGNTAQKSKTKPNYDIMNAWINR